MTRNTGMFRLSSCLEFIATACLVNLVSVYETLCLLHANIWQKPYRNESLRCFGSLWPILFSPSCLESFSSSYTWRSRATIFWPSASTRPTSMLMSSGWFLRQSGLQKSVGQMSTITRTHQP